MPLYLNREQVLKTKAHHCSRAFIRIYICIAEQAKFPRTKNTVRAVFPHRGILDVCPADADVTMTSSANPKPAFADAGVTIG